MFGNIFNQLYGMIEIGAIGTMLRPDDHARALHGEPGLLASIGQPSYGIDVRVKGPAGELLDVSGRGEVVFKGPYVMRGYWNEPDLTARAIRDGWMHSGDVAEIRDGWFYLVDRIKDIIIRGGQNIASKEVEEALYHHPAVMEAAVIGVPSAEWGEDIVAVVVLRPGAGHRRGTPHRRPGQRADQVQVPGTDRLRAGAAAQRDRQDPEAGTPVPLRNAS